MFDSSFTFKDEFLSSGEQGSGREDDKGRNTRGFI